MRDARVEFCPGVWICSRIGPLTWGGVFVPFAFPPRGTPQPRSPMGPHTMPDCAPISGKLKRKCIIFFYPRLLRAQIYLVGTSPNRPFSCPDGTSLAADSETPGPVVFSSKTQVFFGRVPFGPSFSLQYESSAKFAWALTHYC